jgi:N-dimethylarginine dimethylaminohydrolase
VPGVAIDLFTGEQGAFAAKRVAGNTGGGDAFTVEDVVPGSPAAQAGLRTGDRIAAVDGQPVTRLSRDETRPRGAQGRARSSSCCAIWRAARSIVLAMTARDETGPLTRVLLAHARDAFGDQRRVDAAWRALHYLDAPDFDRACAEYDAFAACLARHGAELVYLSSDTRTTMDAIYVRDAAVAAGDGVILGNMGKAARAAEPAAMARHLASIGVPVLGAIQGQGRLEGGDVVWLDDDTVAVGEGYRTNAEGIRQLTALLGERVREVIRVPLVHWSGPDDVFHLMSLISPLAPDLMLVYSRLLPVFFRALLVDRGIALVEVPDEEFASMGGNVLALAPRRCLMLDGNAETRRRLEAAGCEVWVYEGAEISRKGCGGPTCLTRPLRRERARR